MIVGNTIENKRNKLIDINSYPVADVLKILLKDKTMGRNIILATPAYSVNGERILETEVLSEELLRGIGIGILQPRVIKSTEEQAERTRKKAEVFTPSWICNKMNNHCDEEWFGYQNVFNEEKGNTWVTKETPIVFSDGKSWQQYVDSMRLEITCGEAPYLVSRYDTTTGELIPVKDRIGILDRKLRVVCENTDSKDEWMKWVIRAFQSSYGFEFQGDNLLIGRINLLVTFDDYYEERWNERPSDEELRKIANIISWNLWQMDGLTGMVPFAEKQVEFQQLSMFDFLAGEETESKQREAVPARIYDWRSKESVEYNSIKER